MNAPVRSFEITPEQAAEAARIAEKVVPGRSCGSCSLCCKVVSIPELDKPAGRWCDHCRPGQGCGIHAVRPFICRGSFCEWTISKGLGPEWRPDRAKFVLFRTNGGRRLTAHVDPGSPSAWRRSPYYENFKAWAAEAVRQRPEMHLIDVMVGEHATVVLPDREVEIGIVGADELVRLDRHVSGAREWIEVRKIKRCEDVPPPANALPVEACRAV